LKELIVTQDEFRNLLYEIRFNSSVDFSGIGIVVCDYPPDLPIVSLRDTNPDITGTAAQVLSGLSNHKSTYHDGFHVLNKKGKLTHVAQYFSPPIVQEAYFDKSRFVGGRFAAALFGSAISSVIMTGIVSEGHGLSIFKNGKEVHFEEHQ
jgi:hypothetical protein